jgi:hypothetical protein
MAVARCECAVGGVLLSRTPSTAELASAHSFLASSCVRWEDGKTNDTV